MHFTTCTGIDDKPNCLNLQLNPRRVKSTVEPSLAMLPRRVKNVVLLHAPSIIVTSMKFQIACPAFKSLTI